MESDKIVRLNVGGTHYDVAYSTLTMNPDTMLARLVSGTIPTRELDGRIFIDRNGRIFEHILDFLRNGNQWIISEDQNLIKRIHLEAKFFAITDLTRITKKKPNPNAVMNGLKRLHRLRFPQFNPNKKFKLDN